MKSSPRLTFALAVHWASCVVGVACCVSPCSASDLETRLDRLVLENPSIGVVGIHVVEAVTGKTLYGKNQDSLLLPASNVKLFTSAVALERLGPDYRFVTRVVREVTGDVVLVGSGDPSLSGRLYPYRRETRNGPSLQAVEELADQMAAHGVTRVAGDIVGDDRLFPWEPYPPSWTQDDMLHDYGAPVSALTLDDNTVAVSVSAGSKAGDPAGLSVDPAFEYLIVENRVVTASRGSAPAIRRQRIAGTRQWLLTGAIPVGHASMSEVVPVDDPALFAASALYDALTRRGIAVDGRALARHRLTAESYTAPAGQELASRMSPPLSELLQLMDKLSENLHAELILREVGRVTHGEGSGEAGLAELKNYLNAAGAAPGDWRLEDGSGLGRNTLVTPRLLTTVLAGMTQSQNHDLWMSLLPAGGEDGTRSGRLCCMSGGRGVRAKTGSLSRAQALSGYADSATYGMVAFSVLVNDFAEPPGEVRQWIDKIVAELLK